MGHHLNNQYSHCKRHVVLKVVEKAMVLQVLRLHTPCTIRQISMHTSCKPTPA
jgi:hypothetical protein